MERLLNVIKGILRTSIVASVICTGNLCAVDYVSNIEEEASILEIDKYTITFILRVPQVKDNTTSNGYRKYQNQKIKGNMYVKWMSDGTYQLDFGNLENYTFKVGGARVSYKGYEDRNVIYTRYNYIGSNRTNKFKTPCICFYLGLEPSYAKSSINEDNSFYIMVAGSGNSRVDNKFGYRFAKNLSGYVSGTQGCGCRDYSHKSPTRSAGIDGPTEIADDVVATYGRWKAKWDGRVTYSAAATR